MTLLLAGLGGLGVAALSYALDGTDLGKATVGAIKVGVGAVVGGGVSMASKSVGTGIVAGGLATGGQDLLEEALDMTSKPAAGNGETSAVRANISRLNRKGRMGAMRVRQLGAGPGDIDVSRVANASRLGALRVRLRG